MNLFAWITRKAAGGIRCIREHGWRYTLFLAMEKLAVRLWMPVSITMFFLFRILPAYHRYAALKKETGGAHIYCQYYPGTGDVRYAAAYLKIIYDTDLKQTREGKGVLVVSGKSAAGVATLFCPSEIPIIPLRDRTSLSMVHLLRFAGLAVLDMTLLHYFDDTMYTAILFPVMSRKNTTFKDLYTIALLNDSGAEWPEPNWDDDEEWVERVFTEKSLEPHRTVLVSPFANSLAYGPDIKFWERIVVELKRKGFSVCTNVAGSREKPIHGSVGVNIPYRYLNIFCRNAGYFLAFRSGLCDLITAVHCRKVILYPDKTWPDAEESNISTIDFFSLQRMGYKVDIEEYVYRPGMEPEIIVQALLRNL